jgi:hypothetical protein
MTRCFGRFLLLGTLLLPRAAVEAGDVTAFVAVASPTDNWSRGYGAALSSTWFQVLSFEGEAARIPGERTDTTMTTFTGSALLAPPIGFLVPYGGVGVGVFRQTVGGDNDTGTLRAFILGAKVKVGLLVLKGEYRNLQLSGEPLLAMDRRISAGAGISF